MEKSNSNAIVYNANGVPFRILQCTKSTKAGPKQYYLLDDYSTGKRRQLNHTSLAAAKARADAIRKAMTRGCADRLAISHADWFDLTRAKSELNWAFPRLSLADAVHEFVESRLALGTGLSLLEAAAAYRKQHETAAPPSFSPTDLETAAAAYHDAKVRQSKSASHCKNIASRFKRLAKALPKGVKIHELTAGQLENAVAGLGLGPKTSNDYRMILVNFFTWCAKQNPALVPTDFNPAREMDEHAEVHGEVQFLSSCKLRQILKAAEARRPDLLPYLALVAFAGLRPAEAVRLDWSELNAKHIRLPGAKSKTRKSRQIPIQPNLAEWLDLCRKPTGPICPGVDLFHVNAQIERISGIQIPHDGLRHGYGTHRCQILRNIAAVAMEMGNQVRVCERHYINAFCTEDEARDWFSIRPTQPDLDGGIPPEGSLAEPCSAQRNPTSA